MEAWLGRDGVGLVGACLLVFRAGGTDTDLEQNEVTRDYFLEPACSRSDGSGVTVIHASDLFPAQTRPTDLGRSRLQTNRFGVIGGSTRETETAHDKNKMEAMYRLLPRPFPVLSLKSNRERSITFTSSR
ncbi:hypothetical protein RRG08_057028 [Elysia crispata]|uniref:Uncharacterized protein n=1 Tax=Elysia crispata TaxID=231223 RepID=A0AAE1DBA5_9GAST|nr:hypothetical protein RRG08_057028 [Elysia crispata]